ncbi:UDP-3-O-(3-hydroxymyristoyl)glucosamine N-acyltransferase [Hoeflea prorocentri]|uniref:UDP-3-O-(3-hydroxymyristoyl)glucosamine N-acyltransferase n=1 Tax=Hoeflea prorocentri TaxID=1922333 RepID=A0A9X3ZHH6_9HYPH|nr:UDP-3-O-(3-hydroxymyristoyl)glucosamine N-acyltransferase [Hoeflea prorocentri]MCY6380938.1 UDP-3-O-(3-hydroxymyristoyl)glucosamine N-acyltransferase [Hoeflea prorocentri]MDA5398738.1 UDP-3-O-(3-hydroxymyristoyl)glucosamine N-acyltransferase [Hoeflea prorocentri]
MMDDARFPPHHLGIDVTALAEDIGASLYHPVKGRRLIAGVASLSRAGEQDLCVFLPGDSTDQLVKLQAAAIICPQAVAPKVPTHCAVLISAAPLQAFADALELLYPEASESAAAQKQTIVSKHAYVDTEAILEGGRVSVAEGAVIAKGAHIGANTTIGPGAVVGPGCQIGRRCTLSAHATVHNALIGDDVGLHAGVRIGEGSDQYIGTPDKSVRIPQIGRVIIQDKVEIGANSTIDRGALQDTVIGDTTVIESLVSIGFNVRIGRACRIASHVGIASDVSIADHASIQAGATVNASVNADSDYAARQTLKQPLRQTD